MANEHQEPRNHIHFRALRKRGSWRGRVPGPAVQRGLALCGSLQAERAGFLHCDQQLLVQRGVGGVWGQIQAVKTGVSPEREREIRLFIHLEEQPKRLENNPLDSASKFVDINP